MTFVDSNGKKYALFDGEEERLQRRRLLEKLRERNAEREQALAKDEPAATES